jgi:hypothetical protein
MASDSLVSTAPIWYSDCAGFDIGQNVEPWWYIAETCSLYSLKIVEFNMAGMSQY